MQEKGAFCPYRMCSRMRELSLRNKVRADHYFRRPLRVISVAQAARKLFTLAHGMAHGPFGGQGERSVIADEFPATNLEIENKLFVQRDMTYQMGWHKPRLGHRNHRPKWADEVFCPDKPLRRCSAYSLTRRHF